MRRLLGGVCVVACALACGCGSGGGGTNPTPTPTRRNGVTATGTAQSGGPTPTRTARGAATPTPTATPGVQGSRTPTPPGQRTHTATPTSAPTQPPSLLYVREGGNDDNPGTSPDAALKTIDKAATLLKPGTILYVGPGTYLGRVSINGRIGTAAQPIQVLADTTGAHTGDRPGAVVIDANADVVALVVTKSPFVTVDSFIVTGAVPQTQPNNISATGVQIRNTSDHVTIRNCVVGTAGQGDGIRVDGSSDVLIFDNLIFDNDRGLLITGDAPGTRVINNTIVTHQRAAIAVTLKSGVAPTNTSVLNNIIQGNENNIAISVAQGPPSAADTYSGDFNLVFEPGLADQTTAYNPASIRGANDINADALLENVGQGDVRLDAGSPAVDAGTDTIGAALTSALLTRTTSPDNAADSAPLDLGFHYAR